MLSPWLLVALLLTCHVAAQPAPAPGGPGLGAEGAPTPGGAQAAVEGEGGGAGPPGAEPPGQNVTEAQLNELLESLVDELLLPAWPRFFPKVPALNFQVWERDVPPFVAVSNCSPAYVAIRPCKDACQTPRVFLAGPYAALFAVSTTVDETLTLNVAMTEPVTLSAPIEVRVELPATALRAVYLRGRPTALPGTFKTALLGVDEWLSGAVHVEPGFKPPGEFVAEVDAATNKALLLVEGFSGQRRDALSPEP